MQKDKQIIVIMVGLGVLLIGAIWYLVLRAPDEARAPINQADIVANEQLVLEVGQTLFQIDSSRSEARFYVDEILRGEDVTVLGTTQEIAGQLGVDGSNPANTQVGTVQVNARTLLTNENFRNNAIRNRILFTDEYEFITFVPKRLENLPDIVTQGDSFSFEIVGDLTITTLTQEERFQVIATQMSETEIEMIATAVIQRPAYQLAIPSVPSVAWVDEAVQIELLLVLTAVENESHSYTNLVELRVRGEIGKRILCRNSIEVESLLSIFFKKLFLSTLEARNKLHINCLHNI